MKFSLELLPNEPIKDILEVIKLAENIGFENIWITDHYNNRDVFEVLALAAHETSTIHMGSGVSNPFVRNPVTIASATATLNEISDGRAIVGVGPGDKATMETLNLSWSKPVKTVKNAINDIRVLLNGEKLDQGAHLNGIKKIESNIPIYMAAQGPMMLKASGEVADGCLINASNSKDFEIAVPLIKEGIQKGGNKADYYFAAYTACSIDENVDVAYNQAKTVVAFILAGAPDVVLERHNISVDVAVKIRNALAVYDFKTASSLVDENMIDAFSVCGTPEDISAKIEEFAKLGINEFVIGSPIGKDRENALKLVEDIINSFN
ncbi:5,10-methylenetetrahydromethanopterin reductase [Methanosphaera sp. ISO3-F5]|uniref:5,10-methylenetetrahydromethanopterin reductase n=1 Tax=Methanosphaera sp. ISO3-F5 TaxID=1452353 RepID=UPI002B2634F1|nr:5,10-methylenetetrahydromethanopterin reductase [Methanosphaera sp. ISO3-F5]WQH64596.1 5,10-methylenetetrahydromethanopterin reductase [Methanosphaera sp. ISO3-F5]